MSRAKHPIGTRARAEEDLKTTLVNCFIAACALEDLGKRMGVHGASDILLDLAVMLASVGRQRINELPVDIEDV